MTAERAWLRREFARSPAWFPTSPLYRALCRAVAADDALLDLAAERRPGQQPTNILFGVVHFLLLEDPGHELAAWYPSLAGDAARAPETAGPAFARFCRERRADVVALLRTRLVQTNVVTRAGALRYAMGRDAELVDEPVALLEVGCSAGVQLCFDRFHHTIGPVASGPDDATVRVEVAWRGAAPPRLGPLPAIADRLGLDLHPVDAADPVERRWLRALVWPENAGQAAQLVAALDVVAAERPALVQGDATDGIAGVARGLAPGAPLVVFHAATRAHVPRERRAQFDAALLEPARERRLLHVSQEAAPSTLGHHTGPLHLLTLADGDGPAVPLAYVDGHGAWIEPVEPEGR